MFICLIKFIVFINLILVLFSSLACNENGEKVNPSSLNSNNTREKILLEIESFITENNKINQHVVKIYDSAHVDIIRGKIKTQQDFNRLYLSSLTYQRNLLKKNIESMNYLINKYKIRPIDYRPIMKKNNDSIIKNKIESITEFKNLR